MLKLATSLVAMAAIAVAAPSVSNACALTVDMADNTTPRLTDIRDMAANMVRVMERAMAMQPASLYHASGAVIHVHAHAIHAPAAVMAALVLTSASAGKYASSEVEGGYPVRSRVAAFFLSL